MTSGAPPPSPPPPGPPEPVAPVVPVAPPAPPRRLVLDTSLFTNPDIRSAFGPSPTEALVAFLATARRLRGVLEFFMPPSIHAELTHFIDETAVPADIELLIQRKPPNKFELTVPAFLLYELIEDVRRRVDKGLRVAEEAARGSSTGEPERIASLRRKYREALREGIIDSTEDVELILLAKELGGIVVSADRGVMTWAEKLGLRWIDPTRLKGVLDSVEGGGA